MKYETHTAYSIEQPWLPFSELLLEWEEQFHDLMLNDELRMVAYETAIKKVVQPGNVVLDLGTGTGILSQWAIEAGAKKVYGIEMDREILAFAVQRMNDCNFSEKFIPINKLSYDVALPEKVDVVISEIIGNLADNEDFQPIINDILQRLLKPGGRVIPQSVSSYIVPVRSTKAHQLIKENNIATLNPDKYRLETLLDEKHISNPFNLYYDTVLPHSSYLSEAKMLRCYKDNWEQNSIYSTNIIFNVEQAGNLTGFKGYFIANLTDGIDLDISGDNLQARTVSDSWKHAYLPIQNPITVKQGDIIHLNFSRIHPLNSQNNHFRQIYRWRGSVTQESITTGQFDQCLDESLLHQHENLTVCDEKF